MGLGESDGGRGSNGGKLSDRGRREWCGVVEEGEPWSLLIWAHHPCLFLGAGCPARTFIFVDGGCLHSWASIFIGGWLSSFMVVMVGGRGHQWRVVSSSMEVVVVWRSTFVGVVVVCGHLIFMVGARGCQWGGHTWALGV